MKRIRLSRRFRPFIRILLALALLVSLSAIVIAQSPDPVPPVQPAVDPAKSAEALQTRIARARALIAAHRLGIATAELESVRAATQDQSLRNITSIMLMSVYLEEGNYARAEALLEETFQARTQKDELLGTYFALAGQAVNGARMHLTRYRSFGVSTNDTTLPTEVTTDLSRLRSLLERMIAQAKEISSTRKAYDSLSLLEDVVGIRLSLAVDSEDQSKWEVEYLTAREALASSQTQIASLGGIPPLRPAKAPANISSPSPYSTKKTSESPLDIKAPDKTSPSDATPKPAADASAGEARNYATWIVELTCDQTGLASIPHDRETERRRRTRKGSCDCGRDGQRRQCLPFRRSHAASRRLRKTPPASGHFKSSQPNAGRRGSAVTSTLTSLFKGT